MPAKLQGSVLCKLTLGEISPQKKQAPGAARRCDAGGVFVAKRMILWYAVDAASAARALTQNARRLCVLTGSACSPQSEAGVRRAAF